MTDVFAVALGLPDGYFDPFTDHSIDVLRMVNYALPEGTDLEPDQLGMGAHTDYGIVTILWADAVPGLQVLDRAGAWHPVVPAPGALLVNLGDLLARWTNDRWMSTMHRVVPPTGPDGRSTRRRSAAFFHDGNADALISTLAPCRTADGPGYDDVTVAEHPAQKLSGSRGLELNDHASREAARTASVTASDGEPFIPLVDLSRWFDGTSSERTVLATEVDGHLRRCGFLVVTNHRLPRAVVDECREQARRFFHGSPADKAEVAFSRGAYRGWV
eukprot:gene25606-46682_t